MNETYFVVHYFEDGAESESEILKFETTEQLLKYMDKNKNELIAVYSGTCLIDWS